MTQATVEVGGRYRLGRLIGQGASAVVLEAEDLQTERTVALKVFREAEAQAGAEFGHLSRLSHPNIVPIHDAGRLDVELALAGITLPAGAPFLALGLVAGGSPSEHLERLPPARRAAWLRRLLGDLAGALLHLHRSGLRHYDLKPGNVIVKDEGSCVLADLGLAAFEAPSLARGTPAFMAPEMLSGEADHRADLYGLGATAFALVAGRPPFEQEGAALFRAILQQRPRLGRVTWLDAETRALIRWLLRKDPASRPASAQTVLAELARIEGDEDRLLALASRPMVTSPAFVGRGVELAAIAAALDNIAAGPPRRIEVIGPPGAGKSRLIEEAVRRHQRLAVAGMRPAVTYRPLQQGLAELVPSLTDAGVDDRAAAALAALEARARRRPLVVVLAWPEQDPAAGRLLGMLERVEEPLPLCVFVERRSAPTAGAGDGGDDGGLRLEVPPLALEDTEALVVSMVGERPDPAAAKRIQRLSGGIPLLVVELAGQWAASPEAVVQLSVARAPGLEALVRARRAALDPQAEQIVDAVAVWGAPLDEAALMELLGEPGDRGEAIERLAEVGLLTRDLARLDLASPAHRAAWIETATPGRLADAQRRAAAMIAARLASPANESLGDESLERFGLRARRAHLLLDAADGAGPAVALEVAAEGAAGRDPLGALSLLERLGDRGGEAGASRRLLAEALVQCGRYDRVLELLAPPLPDPDLALLRARALQLAGDYRAARETLEDLAPRLAEGSAERRQVDGLLGKVMLRLGEVAEARRVSAAAERILEQDPAAARPGPADAALVEVAGLARYYLGELDEARRYFVWGDRALDDEQPAALRARFANLRGMITFVGGELEVAADHYRRALSLARQAGDAHGAATYTGCVGSTLVDTGRYGEALTHLSAAVRDLGRLGRAAERVAALCNLANLTLALGDTAQAGRLLDRAKRLQAALGAEQWQGWLERLAGDIARRRGALDEASALHEAAARRMADAGDARQRDWALAAASEALAAQGQLDRAAAVLPPLDGAAEPGAVALGWARVVIAARGLGREPPEGGPDGLAEHVARFCAELERRGASSDLWRAALVLGLLLGRRPGARRALSRARRTWQLLVKRSPEVYRMKMADDPDARRLQERWGELLADEQPPVIAAGEPAAIDPYSHQRLRRLLAINKRLNNEVVDLDRLLESIIDAVIELSDAERGFLLLVEPDGTLAIRVARNIDQGGLAGEQLAVSRSIAEQATRDGEPVVTIDAADDGRFAAALSVSNLRLRSVLAVPLSVKGMVVGTIYVDHRLRRGVFGEAEVGLIQDFADQAAIAIDTARLLADNRRRQEEIEQLNQQLASTVESQRAELDEAQEELRSSREALQVRYDHAGIVGRSPRMTELFRLIDRVSDTELPVVIQGASGTGKELVARAIHHHGRRGEGAFVCENCGAIPETLLESVLFGHVRGAFTGADRDRKGLFEIADGGTLFLDEVGEMSPAMQTKLLRVLQDGEFRRVGGERTIRADVRLIAASNADLRRLVEQGAFREDLFYRLNVIRVEIPLLCDRREDIPLLVSHFVAKHGRQEQRIEAGAIKQLCGYGWPGNVRELENEVMRAVALGGPVIGLDDLSSNVRQSSPVAPRDPDDLAIRPRVASLEQELIQRALSRTGGNQSRAARLLGLSRYGLLKKLKRHFGEDPDTRPAVLRARARSRRRVD